MKKRSPKITLAVPAFARPKMIEDIIKSFQLQTLKDSELLVIDDCVEDKKVEEIIRSYQKDDDRIRFIKNKKNLGYCKNFLELLLNANGEYIVILGDDDILINENALKKYVEVFENNPKVVFAYSNIIQFNQLYEMDFAYKIFQKDTLFESTEDSLRGNWLNSCYIPGIGLKNSFDFKALYPKEHILFPQVELIGKMLGLGQSYGISTPLIGGRAHNEQLGFEAMRGKRIKGGERHSIIELNVIYQKVIDFYKNILKADINADSNLIDNFFEKKFPPSFLLTKIGIGNMNTIKLFIDVYKHNKKIVLRPISLFYFIIALVLPKSVLYKIKEMRKKQIVDRQFQYEKAYFNTFIEKL